MKYLVLVTLLVSIIGFAQAKPAAAEKSYSNVIVFGDSLTDIGNGPDSKTMYGDSSEDGIFANLYVPISQPVNPYQEALLPGLDGFYLIPIMPINGFHLVLPAQQQICSNDSCDNKQYRAYNWLEYFAYNGAIDNGMLGYKLFTHPVSLGPWMMQAWPKQNPDHLSVDYAMYSATAASLTGCTDFDSQAVSCATLDDETAIEQNIYHQQSDYRQQQSDSSTHNLNLRSALIIPTAQQQVKMFANDKANARVEVDDNSLYLVYIGANDISLTFYNDSPEQLFEDLSVNIPGSIAGLSGASVLSELLAAGVNADNIYVMGQFNIGLTPGALDPVTGGAAEKYAAATALDQLVDIFNNALQRDIASFNHQHQTTVHYIDIHQSVKAYTKPENGDGFYQTTGQRCEITGNNAQLIEQGKAVRCYPNANDADDVPVAFWNSSHLATQMNQAIAYAVLKAVATDGSSKQSHSIAAINLYQFKQLLQQVNSVWSKKRNIVLI